MTNDTLVETTKGSIKIIRFNKPHRKNAIDKDMFRRLINILNDAAANDNITIVVLTGTGDFYSSGNDMKAESDLYTLIPIVKELINVLIKFPKLLIAIVNGPAVGIATTSLPFCDFVYASENAYFYTPFTKLKIFAEGCATYTFPHLMGVRKAMDLIALNKKIPAKEALQFGLVNNVWKSEELYDKAWEQINELTKLPPICLLMTKKLVRRFDMDILLETNELEMEELKKLPRKSKL